MFGFFKKRKFNRTVGDFIDSYKNVWQDLEKASSDYDSNIENKNYYSDKTFCNGLRQMQVALESVTVSIDSIISDFSKDNYSDFIINYSSKLPKYTLIEFNKDMINSNDFSINDFPKFDYDTMVAKYCSELSANITAYYLTIEKIKVLSNLKSIDSFNKMYLLNKSRLAQLENAILTDFYSTKVTLNKTINFIKLPILFKESDCVFIGNETEEKKKAMIEKMVADTLSLHAYFRFLVDQDFLSASFSYKRFCSFAPKIITQYLDELGFYFVDQKLIIENVNEL